MTDAAVKILCNQCQVSPEPVGDAVGQMYRCPVCGQADNLDDIQREAGQHAKEVFARKTQDIIRRAAAREKTMKFEGNTIPKRVYRWVTEFQDEA